jgi:phosphate transport system protein
MKAPPSGKRAPAQIRHGSVVVDSMPLRRAFVKQDVAGRCTLGARCEELPLKRTLDPVLEDLRERALRMGSLAETILAKALRAVWERDPKLAEQVREDDLAIDRLDVEIDEEVIQALALHQPVADDLRRILAVRTMASDLERVGDLARNIAKSAERLASRPEIPLPPRLEDLADQTSRALGAALDSFSHQDATRARSVIDSDDTIDEAEDRLVQEVIADTGIHPEWAAQEVDLVLIAKNLERVADHATNLAEEVIFLAEARIVRHAAKLGGAAGDG